MESGQHARCSKASQQGDKPKVLIETLSEDLLETFRSEDSLADRPLRRLSAPDGLLGRDHAGRCLHDRQRRLEGRCQDGKPNTDLIPPALIVARYFAAEQAAIEQLEAERDAISRADGGNGRGTRRRGWTAGGSQDRQGQAQRQERQGAAEGHQGRQGRQGRTQVLEAYLALIEQGSRRQQEGEGRAKGAGCQGRRQVRQLSEAEIKTLVVDDKWLAALAASVQGELDRVQPGAHRAHQATGRTLRHAAAEAGRGSGNPRRPRGRTPEEDGVRMEVKPGYKQTEVGVIPEDWDAGVLGELRRFRRVGSEAHCANPTSTDDGVPVVNLDAHYRRSDMLTRTMTITESAATEAKRFMA